MKNYEEIANNLFARRNQYLAEKKAKQKILLSVILPVFSVALISVLVLVALPGKNLKNTLKIPLNDPADSATASGESNIGDDTGSDNKKENGNGEQKENAAKPGNNKPATDSRPDKYNESNKNNKPGKKPDKNTKPDNNTAPDNGNNDNSFNSDLSDNQGSVTDGVTEPMSDNTASDNEDLEVFPDLRPEPNHNKDNNLGVTQNQNSSTDTENEDRSIIKIDVAQLPTKKVYYLGDKFDFRGLRVVGYFSNGDVEDITPYVQIYTTSACYVSNNYKIYMEYTDNSEGINLAYTQFYVQVLEPTINISKTDLRLNVGESVSNSATTDAKSCDITWYSTDNSIVTVDDKGNITAVGSGSAQVYAKVSYAYEGYSFAKVSVPCNIIVL